MPTTWVHAANDTYKLSVANYKVMINNSEYKDTNYPILNYQDKTYAPMSSMLAAAGFKVNFANGIATVESGGTPSIANGSTTKANKKEYILTKVSYKVVINGKDYQDDSYPILNYDGHTYAPMRSMLEAAGLKVDFSNGVATVETPKQESASDTDISHYILVRDIFENTNLVPSFNMYNNDTMEVYDNQKNLLLEVPKNVTHVFEGKFMVLKSYYKSELKPLIEKNK